MRTVLLAGWTLALPSLAAAGPAKVDRGHSGVLFQAHHFEAGYTWGRFNDFRGTRRGERFDYVFASSALEVLDAGIVHDNEDGRYPSDHFPVVARVR